jgi:predicted nucleotidyltransferase
VARSKKEIEQIVSKTISTAAEHLPITAAYLFGSYADDSATDESDIDIAIFSPASGRLSLTEKINLLADIRLSVGAEIELHLFDDSCLAKARPSNLYGLIVSSGRRVA